MIIGESSTAVSGTDAAVGGTLTVGILPITGDSVGGILKAGLLVGGTRNPGD